ncbi:F-box only protein 16 isoform X4 [Nannospalax galili]|uniref:F-box only protein 16 isoform X3 n=1 Tax=Nannospalax galili TaxID=1026970 RepID=UPI0004ED5742|nr:F-box only protein 16 isoform X3 [Nannospalax galili]XP_029416988.1 F-box only protein 16 isoform X4 [Nannospalax galili]
MIGLLGAGRDGGWKESKKELTYWNYGNLRARGLKKETSYKRYIISYRKIPSHPMMAFAPPKSTDGPKMQTKMSTWTPLNHQLLNDQVFEERRVLLGKWFDKWTDSQRRRILTGLLERCSLAQQKFCCRKLQEKIPAEALDFTTKLPRVLSVYIFSFLDPRSLCRCAQVSWHWRNLAELDQLWMLKCLRFNWYISFSPTPFEQGVWKKHYIQMVKELHVTKPKTPPKDGFVVADVQPVPGSSPEGQSPFRASSSLRKKNNLGEKDLPPWRSSDKHPTDIIRFNYLDNCDPEHLWQGRRKRPEVTPDFKRQIRDKKTKLQDRARLKKAQSLTAPVSRLLRGSGYMVKRVRRSCWTSSHVG